MLKILRSLFDTDAQADAAYTLDEQLRLASVVLLVEMMYQDDQVLDEEIQAVKSVIESHFGLQASQAEALFQAACEQAELATDSHEFTSLIAKHYSMEQKIQLIEFLWSVAFADNHGTPLVPIHISASKIARFMHTHTGIRQTKQESAIP